jgi:rhamnosyltransferase
MRATVVDLTFNAKPWISDQLDALMLQKADFAWEVLVIDSGSTDGTVEVIQMYRAKHPGRIRFHEIPNSEFGHGKTRNLAAMLASGEFVVYLTQDAIPAHDRWLIEMLRPFDAGEDVVAVFGQQIPRPDCCAIVKHDVFDVFRRFGPDDQITYQHRNDAQPDQAAKDRLRFHSNVNSAARREFLLDAIAFRDVSYSEDYAFGRDVIEAGYRKAYTPFGSVIHSHSYPLLMYFRRMYDEMRGVKHATGQTLDTSLVRHVMIIGLHTFRDWIFIMRDPEYPLRTKLKWIALAPLYQLARRAAVRLANIERLPLWAQRFLSLEHQQKRSGATQ